MKKGLLAVLTTVAGVAAGSVATGVTMNKTVEKKTKKVDKFKSYYNMLNQWLMLKQEGKSLEEYFVENGYKKIAIYGMGEMGTRLYDELKGSSVEVAYGIDKNATSTYAEIDVKEPDEDLDDVDVIVVSSIFAFDEIAEDLCDCVMCPIISLEDVVYEM